MAPNGIITTVAGQCGTTGAFSGDGGQATSAKLNRPWDVVATPAGDLFISDYYNNRIRMVSGITGVITTIAGNSTATGYTGDGGAATSALLNHPTGLALDSSGNVYIVDTDNNVLRMLAPTAPSIDHIISASGYGAFASVAPGSYMEIYGTNLAFDGRTWAASDFQGTTPPTTIDGVSVTVGGQPAYVYLTSGLSSNPQPAQISALIPSGVGAGQQPVVVTTPWGKTSQFNVNVNPVEPGLLAVPAWNIGGTQYAVSLFPSAPPYTYVLPPDAIAGIPSQRAKAGDTIVLYGIGFGPVNPNITANQPGASSSLTGSLQISMGGVQVPAANIQYAGLAPDFYGLYQFNVLVPPGVPANDKTPITFALNGTPIAQALYLAVQ